MRHPASGSNPGGPTNLTLITHSRLSGWMRPDSSKRTGSTPGFSCHGPPPPLPKKVDHHFPTSSWKNITGAVRPVDVFRLSHQAAIAAIRLFGAREMIFSIRLEQERPFEADVIEGVLAEDTAAELGVMARIRVGAGRLSQW